MPPISEQELQERFTPFAERMQASGLAEAAINTFRYQYRLLIEGSAGLITEAEIEPVGTLPGANELSEAKYQQAGREALSRAVFVKLNGGLGTSMGLEKAKSLLTVKDGLSFLDIIARQVLTLRAEHNISMPLVLMNSFNTRDDSQAALASYPELSGPIPLDFMQHKVPKILQSDFSLASWPENPDLEWCPPGHGDFYPALVTSGMLDKLLAGGYEYAFVSNADNLGAVMDEPLLGYFAVHNLPFMMEVTARTEADRKGGHLARRKNGGLILREAAQCPDDAMDAFQDIMRYTFFNTNNVWVNLKQLQAVLAQNGNVINLPLIRNSKTVDPRQSASPKVYQLETAIGAAISVFEGAAAIEVPRTRFAPVKVCSDLLQLWSDAYILTADNRVVLNPALSGAAPLVQLDQRYYKLINDLTARFPAGAPSLLHATRFTVEGDVLFEGGVVAKGAVKVVNPTPEQKTVKRAAFLEGQLTL